MYLEPSLGTSNFIGCLLPFVFPFFPVLFVGAGADAFVGGPRLGNFVLVGHGGWQVVCRESRVAACSSGHFTSTVTLLVYL